MRAVASALLCAFCLFGLLSIDVDAATTAAAANSATFPDSIGEDPSAADISALTVSNDDRGRLTFGINIPNRPTLAPDMVFLVLLDTDANPASGDPDFGGADYVIELDGPLGGSAAGTTLARWNGTSLTSSGVPQSSLVFSYSAGASISINASELGGTRRFGFSVLAVSGAALTPTGEPDLTNARVDLAPDNGQHLYDVRITPPSAHPPERGNPAAATGARQGLHRAHDPRAKRRHGEPPREPRSAARRSPAAPSPWRHGAS